jgi:hypothetical protein
MDRRRRSSLVGGILLILIGAWFVALQLVPGLTDMLNLEVTWPLFLVAIGGILFVIALVTAVPGLAVPACIVAGVGAILYYQTTAGVWQAWIYAWGLVPSFVGLGVLVANILDGKTGKGVREGGMLILIGLVLFAVLGAAFGGVGLLGQYWPLLIVGFGLLMVLQGLLRIGRS